MLGGSVQCFLLESKPAVLETLYGRCFGTLVSVLLKEINTEKNMGCSDHYNSNFPTHTHTHIYIYCRVYNFMWSLNPVRYNLCHHTIISVLTR